MKIAAVSNNGTSISQHFGRARSYVVVTVENSKIVGREIRTKTGHHTFVGHHQLDQKCGHGYGAGSQDRHNSMLHTISDCQVLIAGGMGWGAYDNIKSRNIETVVTNAKNIDEAVNHYLKGMLPNLMERLH